MTKKIKILETIRQGEIGGGETYLFNLISRLDRNIFEPVLLSFSDGKLVEMTRDAGMQAYVIPTNIPFNVMVYPEVYNLIEQKKFDIVHIHGTRAATNSLLPAKMAERPVIYTVHGWSYHTGNQPLVTAMRKAAEKFIIMNADLVICGSKADLQMGKDNYRKMRGELVYNSIDSAKFDPALQYTNLRSELGISQDAFVVTFLARVTYQKDPLTFLRAANIVKETIPDIKFLFAGDGDMKNEAVAEIERLNLSSNIVTKGFRTDVKNMLFSSDVFVLPSLWEVVPLGLLEAMSMEKACIASNIPGTTEALIDNENGLLFSPGSPKELAEKIIYLYKHIVERTRLQKAARKTVMERFDIQKLVMANSRFYQDLYRGKYGPF